MSSDTSGLYPQSSNWKQQLACKSFGDTTGSVQLKHMKHRRPETEFMSKTIVVRLDFIWPNPFRLQIVVKKYRKQAFLDSTEDSTGKYQNIYFHCGPLL